MHNLLPPMQIRLNDVRVNDQPKFLTENPSDDTHAIILPDPESKDGKYIIPLSFKGVTSTFPTRKPTVEEYENENCKQFELTFESPDFDPLSTRYEEQEDALVDNSGRLRETGDRPAHAHACVQFPKVSPMPRTSPRQAHRVMQFCMTSRTP